MFRRVFTRRPKRKDDGDEFSDIEPTTTPINEIPCETERLVSEDDRVDIFDDLSFIVDYIGSDYISEAQSIPLLLETLKRIKKQHTKTMRVDLVLNGGIFKVTDNAQGALLITAPLYAIALCAQEYLRGFETTFALNITRRRMHMCHVFQAGSRLEGRSIVRAVALSCRSFAKEIKEKRCESSLNKAKNDAERSRADSDSSKCKGKLEYDSGKEYDTVGRRILRLGVLPTLPSEEDLDQMEIKDGDKISPEQLLPVMVHRSHDGSDGVIGNEISSEDNLSEKKYLPTDDEEFPEKRFEPAFSDLFSKALMAIRNHDLKTLQKCLHDGLPIDYTNDSNCSLLHCAVSEKKLDVVEFLLERDADVNIEGKKEQTPLHLAASQGNPAITKVLLAYGANVRKTDRNFRTPLHLCAGCLQSLEVSYVLVEHGARIEDNDIEGKRPVDLHYELYEMQNRLIQSACEALASADISRSRSNSGCSSTTGSLKSAPRSPSVVRRNHRLFRSSSMRIRPSPSLHSIQDVGDLDSMAQEHMFSPNRSNIYPLKLRIHSTDRDRDIASDHGVSGYSTCGSSMREDSNTDSDIENHKETIFSDGYNSESEDITMKPMRGLMDHKTFHHGKFSSSSACTAPYKKDPATDALRLLETLSSNAECQSSILANLCLPRASGQLVTLAHTETSTIINLQQISRLLQNLFTVAGPTGRHKCISAGLLKTVIDLLDGAEPVQGTCLSILNDLLQAENDRDYSGTISGIPIEPLLSIIKSIDTTHDVESGEKSKLKSVKSTDSGYSASQIIEQSSLFRKRHDDKVNDSHAAKSYTWGRNRSFNKGEHFSSGIFDNLGRGRSNSFGGISDWREMTNARISGGNSDSDSKDSSSHLMMPKNRRYSRGSNSSMEVQTTPKATKTTVVAKHVAMKMLTASSRNFKLQDELAKPQILALLLDCLNDNDEQIILQATATLANIAMNIEAHQQIQEGNVEKGLTKLLKHSNPRIRYQAARGLIYMGNLEVDGIYIYNYLPDEDSSPTVIYVEQEGRTFIRGTTIENLILTLTKDIHLLWSGNSMSAQAANEKKSTRNSSSKNRSKNALNEYQIMNFVLSTLQTYVHPIIFMRLLLHRFRETEVFKLFLNLNDDCEVPHMEHYAPLPILHARLMRLWKCWLENYPNDFITFPTIKTELAQLIPPMKIIDGPYALCAHLLESLLNKLSETSIHSSLYHIEFEGHHNILYEQCHKAIKDGRLPCSEEDFVYLAGLQLYIEDLCEYGEDFAERLKTIDSINTTRMKLSIGAAAASSKQLSKKIKSFYEIFLTQRPTERNAKHNYVDCCQGMAGYSCTFFKVRQRILTTRSRKRVYLSRLFGISPKRVVILDERSKVCIDKFNCKDLFDWNPIEDNLTIKTYFKTLTTEKTIEFQLENRVSFKEFSNYMLTCTMERNYQGYQNVDTNPWSKLAEECGTWGYMALQLHVNKTKLENDESPPAERARSTTTTVFPSTQLGAFGISNITSGSKDYSQSAPVKQESWNASELLSFLNLKGRPRSRGEMTILNISPSNSDTGGTPPKDLILDKNNIEPSCSVTSQESIMDAHREAKLKVSGPMLPSVPEKPLIMDEVPPNEKISDLSPVDYPKYGNSGKMLTCHCPPDADLPNLNLREFSAYELLDHPKELARQITLIDHERLCSITSKDVLLKISFGLIKKCQKNSGSHAVDKIAERFNQMSNWIIYSIVSERNVRRRAKIFKNFIETAKQCLELRNYNAVMAIVVAALGSTPVRRLEGTKEQVPPESMSCLQKMESLMDSKGNYKKYREALRTSPTPAVPYFGIIMKDLRFISDGNPDYLKGGVINLNKRRKVYDLLEEIQKFQKKRYNFQMVPEIKEYLLSKPEVHDEQLLQMSKENEPAITSRLGSVTPPVTPYHFSDRRVSIPSNFFRNNGCAKTSSRRLPQRSATSATPV